MDLCSSSVVLLILGLIGGVCLVKKVFTHAGTPAGAAQIGGGLARWFTR